MKSLSQQSVMELGGDLSVLSLQKQDHIELDALLHRLAEAEPQEQRGVLLEIYRLVFPHAFAEEALLWPVIRRVLPEGHALTLRVEQEHQDINELVTRLEAMEPGSAEHEQVLSRVVGLLRQDVRDEEDELLPRIQAELSPAQLRLLGVAWGAVRQIAPTRAHPIVSRRPPGNVVSALPHAVIDRCRDLVDTLLDRGPEAAAAPLKALSSGLAAASHGIERLPGMRSGEDPSTRRAARRRGWPIFVAGLIGVTAAIVMATRRPR
jgi:hemerythrin superfamily protein